MSSLSSYYHIFLKKYLYNRLRSELKGITKKNKSIDLGNIQVEKLNKLRDTLEDFITKTSNEIIFLEEDYPKFVPPNRPKQFKSDDATIKFYQNLGTNLTLIKNKLGNLIKYKEDNDSEGFKKTLEDLSEDLELLSQMTKGEKGIVAFITSGVLAIITGIFLAIILPIIESKKMKKHKIVKKNN